MYDKTFRGLESPGATQEPTSKIAADGGVIWTDLSGFQRDCIEAIARLERADAKCHGLAIKRRLESARDGEINHGRLYPNLDELVRLGFVEKGQIDLRTNSYGLTDCGEALLIQRAERLAEVCELQRRGVA